MVLLHQGKRTRPGIEYTNSTVDAIYHAEGRAVKDGSTWDHEYVITDHLGNTRVRFHDDNGNGTISSGELLSTHDYYPFGMEWNAGSYQYTYNGKEKNDELGLDLFDYGARMYDPAIGRWNAVDPLAENRLALSPFNFVQNNPISRIDPDGLTDYTINKKTGEVTQIGETNDELDRVLKTNREGKVRTRKNGEARVAFDGIEKGILKEGRNFKKDDVILSVGGENEPTLEGVEDFLTKLTEYIGVENSGVYLSNEDGKNARITTVYLDEYEGNKAEEASSSFNKLHSDSRTRDLNVITRYHTHPTNTGKPRRDIERPSKGDDRTKEQSKGQFHNFLILTRSEGYPTRVLRIYY